MYKVLTPFNMGGKRINRGTMLEDGDIEHSRNYVSLRADGYIEKMANRYGQEFVPHCYIANRTFTGKGTEYRLNDFVDLREGGWRNEAKLLESKYLRYATLEEVLTHSPQGSMGATPGPLEPPKLYKNIGWLIKRYKGDGASIPEMAEEANCSRSTLWTALKNANIKTRSVGRPAEA